MLESVWNIIQVALGIGLVIFVHEAGHFMAARWCKVRVEVFSLGFGPKLFGWKSGDTQYQVAAVPLGGYVKMAGEDMYDPEGVKHEDDLGSKSVPQRLLIYSGGVIMNMIFALIVFPIILMVGVPFNQPIVQPVPGGAAWEAGIEPGTLVEEVDGKPIYAFTHIVNGVALSDEGPVQLTVREPGSETSKIVEIQAETAEDQGLYTIGVGPAYDPERRISIAPDSPASEAGLKPGYRLIRADTPYGDYPLEQQISLVMGEQAPLTVTFLDENDTEKTVTLEPAPLTTEPPVILGVTSPVNLITRIRANSLASKLGLEKGMVVLRVNDRPIARPGELKRILSELEGPVSLSIRNPEAQATRTLELGELSHEQAIQLASEIALTSDLESAYLLVHPDSAAEQAGIQTGDRVLAMNGESIANFKDIQNAIREGNKGKDPVAIKLERVSADGTSSELEFEVKPAPYASPSYGFALNYAEYIYKADNPIEAAKVGFVSSWRFIEDAFLTLKGMLVTDRVGSKNLGGIITIAVVADSSAKQGLTKLLFFLCLLSVNLAFLNVLPIPVLDGGQIFFLMLEALKGSPVSERVMSYSQLVGLVIIVSLMIYVIKNDIVRWILL